MPSTKDVVLLAMDDAIVTMGAQFREVALGLLITALNPAASSYAWYFLVGSIPGLILAGAYAWSSRWIGARVVMMASYGVRILMVLGLWRIVNFWAALALLAGIAAGSGFYSAAQAHYVAVHGDFARTRRIVVRLRQSESAMRLIGPLIAGAVLLETGYRSGFLFCAIAYAMALLAVSQLTPQVGIRRRVPYERFDWRPDGAAIAMLGLSFLTWQANTLAMAYTFHVLHRGAVGYGLTLSVWGGSGIVASMILSRIQTRPIRWIPLMFLAMGIGWLVLSRGVGFSMFVGLSAIEGCAGWMVQDLATAFILSEAPSGCAGQAQARLSAFEEVGSILGMVTILVVPVTWLVLPLYAGLGVAGILIAGVFFLVDRHKQEPFQSARRM
ncbi:MAG: hypothetical protein C7B46_00805 [Sulfobacillus benefaciens]|uniref:MFS transporter n=1 Tax=Sulfobacillus benefaciens TaxID=453960 RepID=A0A2T2XM95_9FIRM|nr:MAG: hypothetical protein C7B46_00805 [Sulfobacillus benefaciens]